MIMLEVSDHIRPRVGRPEILLCLALATGTRHWPANDLQKLQALQVKMTRRVACWFSKRRSAWAQTLGPRGAGRNPRVGPRDLRHSGGSLPYLIGATRGGDTIRCLHGSSARCGAKNRLRSGHRHLGRRCWDDIIQATTGQTSEAPWQRVAQDRAVRPGVGPQFIARATRTAPKVVERISPGRRMLVHDEGRTGHEYHDRMSLGVRELVDSSRGLGRPTGLLV